MAGRDDDDEKTGDSKGFLEENEDALETLAEAVGESDAGKIAGAAAALATKALTGSSVAASGVEKAVAKAFGRWFADHPDARMKALAAAWKREDAQAATLGQFAALVRPMLENLQNAAATSSTRCWPGKTAPPRRRTASARTCSPRPGSSSASSRSSRTGSKSFARRSSASRRACFPKWSRWRAAIISRYAFASSSRRRATCPKSGASQPP